jgi:glycopeptide antibiotics resistance protein
VKLISICVERKPKICPFHKYTPYESLGNEYDLIPLGICIYINNQKIMMFSDEELTFNLDKLFSYQE